MKMNMKALAIIAAAALAVAACGDEDENNVVVGNNTTANNTTANNTTANNTTANNTTANNTTANNTTANNTTANNTTPNETARVQVIHNAADPAAATVDVYANGEILLDDFEFRTASPFVDVPAGVDIEIAVAGGDSTSVEDALATFGPYNLDADSTTVIVANGVLTPGDFEANPDGEDIGFTLWAIAGQEAAADATKFDIQVVHGATDAPTVDLRVQGSDTPLVDDATYGAATGYLALDPMPYTLELTNAAGDTVVATYDASAAAGLTGQAAVAVASGFLTPEDPDPTEPAFGVLVFLPTGGAGIPLPAPAN